MYLMIGLMFAAFYSAAYYFKHMMFSAPGQLRGHGRAVHVPAVLAGCACRCT